MDTPPRPDPFPGHDGGAWSPAPCRTVASWPAGAFAENLAVDPAGTVFVSLHSHSRIDRYRPETGGTDTFAHLPAPVAGLAFDAGGTLWATGGTPGTSPGFLWRIDAAGAVEEWAVIPDAVFLNGCTPHPDGRTLLVCESMTGRILAIDQARPGVWSAWITDERLAPRTPGATPGANGIKLRAGAAVISVTDRDQLLHAPLQTDGSAGPLSLLASSLRADDFAVTVDGGLLIATHPANTLLHLAPDGARTTIAGPDHGMVGSTACAFGRAPADLGALYVTTNGGVWSPYRGQVQDAKLVRVELAAPLLN